MKILKYILKTLNYFFLLQISITMFVCTCHSQSDDEKPLWEAKLYNAMAKIPHYPGSNEYNNYVFPLPYLIYRGDILRADRKGIRGIFYKSDHVESKISIYGNQPVNDDNKARAGMPELDALIEIGPALDVYFNERNSLDSLYLKFALRGAFSLGFDSGIHSKYQGLHGNVNLVYWNTGLFRKNKFRFGFSSGIIFADKDFNSYFYDVEEPYVLPERGFYKSDGGYSGFILATSMGKTLTKTISFGSYIRWDNLNKASFEDSPLVKQKNNYIIGCVLIWKFAESKRLVKKERPIEE